MAKKRISLKYFQQFARNRNTLFLLEPSINSSYEEGSPILFPTMNPSTKRKGQQDNTGQAAKTARTETMLDPVDTYVNNEDKVSFPFRHLPAVLNLSSAVEEMWISEDRKLFANREPVVKAMLRQVFDKYLSCKKEYTAEASMSNSFKRVVDFNLSTVQISTIIRLIQARGGFVLVTFKFVYNPIFVGKMLEKVREPTYGQHTGIQTIVMVTNCLRDVKNVVNGKRECMRHVLTGTDCTTLLSKLDYDALGRKYIIVCDALVVLEHLRRQDNSHIIAMCPYYVITTESRALREMKEIALDPSRQIRIVQGKLYPELAMSNGDVLQHNDTDPYMDVIVSVKKNIELNGKTISLIGTGSRVVLNQDDLFVYTIEEFLTVTTKGASHNVTALSSSNEKKIAQIIAHNQNNVLRLNNAVSKKMKKHFMYIAGNNKITVIFEKGDYVFVTEQSRCALVGKRGFVRNILHPALGAKYDVKTHFHQLAYFVEFEKEEDTMVVVAENALLRSKCTVAHLTPLFPLNLLKLAISDICHCTRPVV